MAGDYRVFSEVLSQFSVVEAKNDAEMVSFCESLSCYQNPIKGSVGIITGSGGHGAMAVDARIVLQRQMPSMGRYAHMAIHPYPAHLVSHYQLHDGTDVVIRPIRPEDASIEDDFVRGLSPQAKYFRFMRSMNELTQEMLIRFTQLDYHRDLALIAVVEESGKEIEVGVARYAMNPDGKSCEFALVVADTWQRKGIGTQLMTALMKAARQRGFKEMEGEILSSNRHMLDLVKSLGFTLQKHPDDGSVTIASHIL